MNFGGFLSGLGSGMQQSSQAALSRQPQAQQSPTSAFVQAARQAQLERQQAQGMQMQTAPTATAAATPGGAVTQIEAPSPVPGGAALPTMQSQGALSLPPGGFVTQGQPDPEIMAAMYRGF